VGGATPLYFMITKEYILHEDGMFYQRESIMTPIVDQHNLVKACKLGDTMQVSDYKHRFNFSDRHRPEEINQTSFRLAEYIGVSDTMYAFVSITKFKFPNANLYKHTSDDGNEYNLMYPYPVNEQHGFSCNVTPAFNPMYADLYIMHKIEKRYGVTDDQFTAADPYLFGITKDDKTPVIFNLPNVFDNGRICTGSDYGRDLGGFHNVCQVIEHLTKELFASPANNDLRAPESQERQYLCFDIDGIHINNSTKPTGRFMTEMAYSPAVEFANSI